MSSKNFEYNPFSNNGTTNKTNVNKPSRTPSSFNPFDENADIEPKAVYSGPEFQPATTSVLSPTFHNSNMRKESFNDLERREKSLKQITNVSSEDNSYHRRISSEPFVAENNGTNNFPPLPSCCCFNSCFYQNISVEIMTQYQYTVKLGFYLWILYSIVLFLNIFGTLTYFLSTTSNNRAYIIFVVSIIICLLFIPLSYVFCFRPLYNGFKSLNSLYFVIFFICYGLKLILMFIQLLGIDILGSCGWINALGMLKSSITVSVIMMVIAFGFSVSFIGSFFLYFKVHRLYRSLGGPIRPSTLEGRKESIAGAIR